MENGEAVITYVSNNPYHGLKVKLRLLDDKTNNPWQDFSIGTKTIRLQPKNLSSVLNVEGYIDYENTPVTPITSMSITKDSKSMLEELKMRGFGNGIVKKLMKSLESVKNIFYIIGKHLGAVVGSIVDMFAYTSLLIPIMNGVMFIINKYDLNLETLPQNFLGLAVGVGTIITKHGIVEIINRIKNRFPINPKEVLDDIETPAIQRFASFGDSEEKQDGDLIKEQ